jgi:hypothetical protein
MRSTKVASELVLMRWPRGIKRVASLLGHSETAVRLAGAYAVALLADDWPAQRQQCVDVLCAYLRMPWQQGREDDAGDREVRRVILSVIADHLHEDRADSWCNLRFDLAGARLPDFALNSMMFGTPPRLVGCRFYGMHTLDDVILANGGDLNDIVVEANATVKITQARILGGCLSLSNAKILGRLVIDTSGIAPNGTLQFTGIDVRGTMRVSMASTNELQGKVTAEAVVLRAGGRITVERVSDKAGSQPELRLERWRLIDKDDDQNLSLPPDVDRLKLTSQ